jgi:elongator complex protein 3
MNGYSFNYTDHLEQLVSLFKVLEGELEMSEQRFGQLLSQFPKQNKQQFRKSELVIAYRQMAGSHGLGELNAALLRRIQMKPTRTISGVTPVTVLTKPFPCPGKCIFCPNDIRMPKSYLADEPGAQRAERNSFDPYLQTFNRLLAFQNTGHLIDKVEIIVLGGTWSYYPEHYQIWFIKECFRALNDFSEGRDDRVKIEAQYEEIRERLQQAKQKLGQKDDVVPTNIPAENKELMAQYQIHGGTLDQSYNHVISHFYVAPEKVSGVDQLQTATWEQLEYEQRVNETSKCRSVGLVIETRPDNISEAEVTRIRRLGCTKTQIGVQSLNDDVLKKNNRGHAVASTRKAFKLLRQAGFKIHAHWMPNLYGSTPELDKQDYLKLFEDPDFCPDELKIYPCSLIESAELMQYYQNGSWKPYTEEELLDVLSFCLLHTPRYCRLTRVIRDIPSTDIVAGNKKTNFREIVERELDRIGQKSQNIRAREVRGREITAEELQRVETVYDTSIATEIFIEYVVPGKAQDMIAGFLRLSIPKQPSFFEELKDSAMIREVHVYGQSVGIGQRLEGKAQHLGLGTKLIARAKELAVEHGFSKLAVISAIGTREYYRQRGFIDKHLYQICDTISDGGGYD